MPLRRRLLVFISLVLLACLLGGGALTYWQGVRKIELEMSSAITVGENAVRDSILPLSEGPITSAQIQRVIGSFDGDRHLSARVENDAGALTTASKLRPPADPAPAWLNRLLMGPAHTAKIDLPHTRGQIILEANPLNEISEVWEDAKIKLAIIAGFCSLVLILVSATLKRALRPLENLSSALQRVGGGDYEAHVPESGPQELAAIYKGFNTMAVRLSDAERQNRRLNEQLTTVQDEERAEIARDLHDEIGPFLFAVDVDAQTIQPLLERDAKTDVIQRADAIRQSVAHMQTHLRSILSRLRPARLLDLSLQDAAEQLAAFWSARYPAIAFEVKCDAVQLGAKLDDVAFRILQEGTSNAVRHGTPTRIELSAHVRDGHALVVEVTDNGSGLEETARKGFGIAGMRERIALHGGSLRVVAGAAGNGVTISATLPLEPAPLQSVQESQRPASPA